MKRGKSKERLDKILVDLGFFENKSKASAAILAGNVMIGTEVITKGQINAFCVQRRVQA